MTPECLYGTETVAMIELQQQRLQLRVRKQMGTKNSKSNEGMQEKNGGVKRRECRGASQRDW